MIRTIFFDFDGVILNSVTVKTEAFREIYLEYGEDVADKAVAHHIENGGISRFEKFRLYHRDFLGKELTEKDVDILSGKFSNIVFQKVISSSPIPGALQFIKNATDVNKYVVSGTPDDEIKLIVETIGLKQYFMGIYGSPEKKESHVKRILSEKIYKPQECVFIGDALADYKAAEKNNIHFVLVESDDNRPLFSGIKNIIRVTDLLKIKDIIREIS